MRKMNTHSRIMAVYHSLKLRCVYLFIAIKNCYSSWQEYESYCYKVLTSIINKTQASSACSAMGAQLLYISDETENQFIAEMLFDNGIDESWTAIVSGEQIKKCSTQHSQGPKMFIVFVYSICVLYIRGISMDDRNASMYICVL